MTIYEYVHIFTVVGAYIFDNTNEIYVAQRPNARHYAEIHSELEDSIGPLASEIRDWESDRREGGKIHGVRADWGHQEIMTHQTN